MTRSRSKRAWLLPVAILATDVLLLATGRAFIVGSVIGLEYRYQTEVALAAALALGAAYLPVVGADESAEPVGTHPLLDRRRFVAACLAAFVTVSAITTSRFMAQDLEELSPRTYFDNVATSLREEGGVTNLADRAVPERIWTGFSFPGNLYSRMLLPFETRTRYPEVSDDRLSMLDDRGVVRPVVLDVVRRNKPGRAPRCGYRVGRRATTVPLDGPVIGGGWWIRIGYVATGASPMTVTAGDRSFRVVTQPGVHSLFVEPAGDFDSVQLSGLRAGAQLCTNDITLGTPQPFGSTPGQSR